MAWEDETVLHILDQLGREATLWILVLSEGRTVGTGMASHYQDFPGKIKSYAKDQGIELPEDNEIREGFRRLKRVEFPDTEGSTDSVIVGDKPDYVKLTDHGLTLVSLVSQEELRKSVKVDLGIDVENDEGSWWPRDYDPEDATIQMKAVSERPDDDWETCEIVAVAQFTCGRCGDDLEHSYSFVEPTEAWSKRVDKTCSECGITWEHAAGDPYDDPIPVDD